MEKKKSKRSFCVKGGELEIGKIWSNETKERTENYVPD